MSGNIATSHRYFYYIHPEILETTFSFRKFRAVPCRFRVPLMSFNHFVSNRFRKRKGPLFNYVVSFRLYINGSQSVPVVIESTLRDVFAYKAGAVTYFFLTYNDI